MVALSLSGRLRELKNPRDPRGPLYPLVPSPALGLAATLAGRPNVAAVARFGRARGAQSGHAPGFESGRMPRAKTSTSLLAVLAPDAPDAVTAAWLVERIGPNPEHIAIDGTVLRGGRDGTAPGQHLLAACAPEAPAVPAQMRVEATTGEHEVASRMPGVSPSSGGTAVAADATFPHEDFCADVPGEEGGYIPHAEGDQPDLKAHLEGAFTAAESGDFFPATPSRVRREPRHDRLAG